MNSQKNIMEFGIKSATIKKGFDIEPACKNMKNI